jgi:hypothetical protein
LAVSRAAQRIRCRLPEGLGPRQESHQLAYVATHAAPWGNPPIAVSLLAEHPASPILICWNRNEPTTPEWRWSVLTRPVTPYQR